MQPLACRTAIPPCRAAARSPRLALALLCGLVSAEHLSAQVLTARSPSPAAHVRVWTHDGRLRGQRMQVLRADVDTLLLTTGEAASAAGRVVPVTGADVRRLEIAQAPRDRASAVGRRAAGGALFGLLAGTAVGLAVIISSEGAEAGDYGALNVALAAPVVGLTAGLLLGGASGARHPGDRWVVLFAPPRRGEWSQVMAALRRSADGVQGHRIEGARPATVAAQP